jgi:hypothetical protein
MRPLFFLEDSQLKKNLLVLVAVLITCALGAQLLRKSPAGEDPQWSALRLDMIDGLERLWNTRGHQVELLPAEGGVNASVQVVIPAGTSERQQQWNQPFLHFVAQRHGTPLLKGLSLPGLSAEATPSASASMDNSIRRPYAGGASVDRHLILVRRQAQSWLDSNLGKGNGLALVDGEMHNVPQFDPHARERHYLMPRDRASKRGPSHAEVAPIMLPEYTTVLVVVLNGRAEGAEAKLSRLPELEQALRLDLSGRDSRRLVVLP